MEFSSVISNNQPLDYAKYMLKDDGLQDINSIEKHMNEIIIENQRNEGQEYSSSKYYFITTILLFQVYKILICNNSNFV